MDDLKQGYRDLAQDEGGGADAMQGETGDQAGTIGESTGHDLGNLGDGIATESDQTFPAVEPSDRTM
jgi:hypothetical protein